MKIKTRFAPSPTGHLHIGSVRTALYSWLFARHNEGDFILRIEDSDIKRSSNEFITSIINDMKWLGLDWNEGPYYQTKRFQRYNEIINYMLSLGVAYKCYCSKERIENLRCMQMMNKQKPRYDSYCLQNNKTYHNKPYVVRFRNPKTGFVTFHDQIRGDIQFSNEELDDLIICRTNGLPTYNFCVAIDDWDMGITHVIRGEDHINNTPRQINILKSINAKIPMYSHISMILDENGRKFSKRQGIGSVMDYRNEGYLPEALLNYLVRLGWSHGNKEIFSINEMIKLFTLKAVNKSASIFNIKKLNWINNKYINTLSSDNVIKHLYLCLQNQKINTDHGPNLHSIIHILGQKCNTLKEIAICCKYFYEDSFEFDPNLTEKYLTHVTYKALKLMSDKLININNWDSNNILISIKNTANELYLDIGIVYMSLRLAITGTNQSPSINSIMQIIGRDSTIKRIKKTLEYIEDNILMKK
ncbi:MAG: glutamate--tRNA ligase [Pantoea sp. Brub]|nr:glutamate--tRNA ligase [Pantoea sp. Brub]